MFAGCGTAQAPSSTIGPQTDAENRES